MKKMVQEKAHNLGPAPTITEQDRLDILKYVENEEATVSSFNIFIQVMFVQQFFSRAMFLTKPV